VPPPARQRAAERARRVSRPPRPRPGRRPGIPPDSRTTGAPGVRAARDRRLRTDHAHAADRAARAGAWRSRSCAAGSWMRPDQRSAATFAPARVRDGREIVSTRGRRVGQGSTFNRVVSIQTWKALRSRRELTTFHSARHMPIRPRAEIALRDPGPLRRAAFGHPSHCRKQARLRFPLQPASPCGASCCGCRPIKEIDDGWKTLPQCCDFAPPKRRPRTPAAPLRPSAKPGRERPLGEPAHAKSRSV